MIEFFKRKYHEISKRSELRQSEKKKIEIYSKLFLQWDKVAASSSIEKFPKIIITHIISYLEAKDLAVICRLNKFFFKFLIDSSGASLIWKCMIQRYLDTKESIKEDLIEDFFQKAQLDVFEKKMNKYLIYFKYLNNFEWDKEKGEAKNFSFPKNNKAEYVANSQTRTIVSKNVFKGPRVYYLDVCYYTEHPNHYTIGVVKEDFDNYASYCHTGSGKGIIASYFGSKRLIKLKIILDLLENQISIYDFDNPNNVRNFDLVNLVPANGLRLAVSQTYKNDSLEITKLTFKSYKKVDKKYEKLLRVFDNKKGFEEEPFQNLPTNILMSIFLQSDLKTLIRLSSVNTFFFMIIVSSEISEVIWKNQVFNQCGYVQEEDVDYFCKQLNLDESEKIFSRYYIYLKFQSHFEWSVNNNNRLFFNIIQSSTIQYRGHNQTKTAVSKNIFFGKKIYFVDVSYYTEHAGHFTFGVASADYADWNSYCHAGNASGMVAREFGSGKVMSLSLTIDLISNRFTIESNDNKTAHKSLDISRLNPKNGVRLVVSQTYTKDFVRIGKFFCTDSDINL